MNERIKFVKIFFFSNSIEFHCWKNLSKKLFQRKKDCEKRIKIIYLMAFTYTQIQGSIEENHV